MGYSSEYISETLKDARQRKGLSQRELGNLAGVPQSHISKIESGAVDLRLSSLIELARVLDLELTLVPRKSSAAVSAIVRSAERSNQSSRAIAKEFSKLQETLKRFSESSANKDIARLDRQLKELSRFEFTPHDMAAFQKISKSIQAFQESDAGSKALKDSVSQIIQLRNRLVHSIPADSSPRPAYTLEDEEDG